MNANRQTPSRQKVYSQLLKDVFQRDKGHCRYCGKDMTGFNDWLGYTLDHLESRCVGGKDVAENLVLSCWACNNLLARATRFTTFEARKAELERIRQEYRPSWEKAVALLGAVVIGGK